MSASMPQLAWLSLRTDDLARSLWQAHVQWPYPLSSSPVGTWELPLDELLGETKPNDVHRPRGEQRLVDSLVAILGRPSYCAYVIRLQGKVEDYYAVVANGDEAILVISTADGVQLARVPDSHIAVALAAAVPPIRSAPTVRIEIPAQTAALISSGRQRAVPERTLRSAMASAGIPDSIAGRVLAGDESVLATGIVGAVRFSADGMVNSTRPASWTEMADGAMISARNRAGALVWEPVSAPALSRVIAEALTGLSS